MSSATPARSLTFIVPVAAVLVAVSCFLVIRHLGAPEEFRPRPRLL